MDLVISRHPGWAVGGGRSRRREPQDLTLPASSTERLDAVGYLLTADAYLHPGASCVHDDLLALEGLSGSADRGQHGFTFLRPSGPPGGSGSTGQRLLPPCMS